MTQATTDEILTARELMADPMFVGIPPKFLLWQEGLAVRRRVRAGEVLCRRGDPGNTAYLIKSGRLLVTAPGNPPLRLERGPEHLILGEMACLSGKPRNADVAALQDSEIWEIRRNVLDRLMRSPAQRERFDAIYRERSLDAVLRESQLFDKLSTDEFKRCADFLRPRLAFVRVSPGQKIFDQADWADHCYLVRLGNVQVTVKNAGRESNLIFRGPGTTIGEIGLLALSRDDANKSVDEIDRALGEALHDATGLLSAALPAGRRTATCAALDHVELARVSRENFLEMVKTFPIVRRRLVELSLQRLKGDSDDRPAMRQYVDQGLYQGQSLLVLDLTKCTRCDDCVRACVDQHGTESHGVPLTRMLRQGLHFGDFLVATSCRSCKDAYCMIGCPVDAIHRGKHQQIVIEDHCIGCGLCANNCPYGNIWMAEDKKHPALKQSTEHPGRTERVAKPKAATCDLCDAEGNMDTPKPRCVHACPHDAAQRMSGDQLLREVTRAGSATR